MAGFSDKLNKAIARGTNVLNTARALEQVFGGGRTAARGQSISDAVIGELRKNGVARPTYAYTEVSGYGVTEVSRSLGIRSTQPLLTYRNDGFSIPGISIATSELRPTGTGPTVKRPYGVNYQDVTFNYILDASSNQHAFFYRWMDYIVRHSAPSGSARDQGLLPHEVGYLEDYAATITVWYFDETFDRGTGSNIRQARAEIVDAYPIFIGDVQYNWGGTDQLIRLPVTYTYSRWHLPSVGIETDLSTTGSRSTDIYGQLLRVGSALQSLSTLRSPQNVADVLNIVNVGRNIF